MKVNSQREEEKRQLQEKFRTLCYCVSEASAQCHFDWWITSSWLAKGEVKTIRVHLDFALGSKLHYSSDNRWPQYHLMITNQNSDMSSQNPVQDTRKPGQVKQSDLFKQDTQQQPVRTACRPRGWVQIISSRRAFLHAQPFWSRPDIVSPKAQGRRRRLKCERNS
jgi:hypothetical protein